MTSSQNDPRVGFDETIGGDARDVPGLAMQTDFGTDIVSDIFDFNEQVIGLPEVLPLNPLTKVQAEWLNKFVLEELSEFNEAFERQAIVEMVDAVCDLIYGAMGTLKKMGLTRQDALRCFAAVHAANMTKKRGNKGRGSDEDATKPSGFVAPDQVIGEILFGS